MTNIWILILSPYGDSLLIQILCWWFHIMWQCTDLPVSQSNICVLCQGKGKYNLNNYSLCLLQSWRWRQHILLKCRQYNPLPHSAKTPLTGSPLKLFWMFLQLSEASNIFISTQIQDNDYYYDNYTLMVTSYK